VTEPVNVADYLERAGETVDPQVWCFFEGGSGDEVTLRANAAAYSRWRLRPRMLVDVSAISLETTLLGTPVSMRRSSGAAARSHVRDAAAAARGPA